MVVQSQPHLSHHEVGHLVFVASVIEARDDSDLLLLPRRPEEYVSFSTKVFDYFLRFLFGGAPEHACLGDFFSERVHDRNSIFFFEVFLQIVIVDDLAKKTHKFFCGHFVEVGEVYFLLLGLIGLGGILSV